MTSPLPPLNANEFIEQQLSERLRALAGHFKSEALGFNGPLEYGVDDVVRNVVEETAGRTDTLTVFLTTDGGYIEVVHRIVDTLRHHYRVVNFVVPDTAYSAGTVLAMSGDRIYMDYYSRLGPIDPQVQTSDGSMVPALGYLVQWGRLVDKAQAGTLTVAEAQLMIQGFDQAQLYQFEQDRELSVTLLMEWLATYKFKNWDCTETRKIPVTEAMKRQRAEEIARELNNTDRWHSHGRGISMEVLRRDLNLKIDDFGADPEQSRMIKAYHRLLTDYMGKMSHAGAVHSDGRYWPYYLA